MSNTDRSRLYREQNRRCANCDIGCLEHYQECLVSGQLNRHFCVLKYDDGGATPIKVGICKGCKDELQREKTR